MIARLEGTLESIEGSSAYLRSGHFLFEVLVPAADQMRLSAAVGETIAFHTLFYLESQGQGASFIPRLVGFGSPADRDFFELFTTVKGIGNRKALRALQMPFGDVARAIAERNVDLLVSLPEIGKRTAEAIIVELKGKIESFVKSGFSSNASAGAPGSPLLNDAVAVLVQLGEPRHIARQLAERALAADPAITTPDSLVAAAYRLKELV